MNVTQIIYLADVIGALSCFILCITVLGFIILCFTQICWAIEHGKLVPHIKKLTALFFSFGLITCVIPSKDTIYMMAAAELGKEIANNPKIDATIGKLFKVIDKKLDEQIAVSESKTTK